MTLQLPIDKEKIRSLLPPEDQARPPFIYSAETLKQYQEKLQCTENELLLGLCTVCFGNHYDLYLICIIIFPSIFI